MQQLNFNLKKSQLIFGGSNLKSAPKSKRPIDTKSATHLTLKCFDGVLRLPKTMRIVNEDVSRLTKKYDFTLYNYSNNFNHLHLVIRITNRHRWRAFIRELTGAIAQSVKKMIGKTCRFWLGRPFTRIIKGWGKNYRQVMDYVDLNILEAERRLTRAQARALQNMRRTFSYT